MVSMSNTPISDFASLYRTKSTSANYATAIRRFLAFIYDFTILGRNSTKKEVAAYEKLAARYLRDTKRNRALDLLHFVQSEGQKKVVPCSVRIRLVAVRQWFAENDISLSEKDKMRLRRVSPRGGRRTNFRYLNMDILRDLLPLLDVRMRSVVLVAASTGMRIGEILDMKWSAVTIPDRTVPGNSGKLTQIFIPDSKTQSSRRVWLTREAEDSLLVWKNQIPDYMVNAQKFVRNLGHKYDNSSDRVFPFTSTSVHFAWNAALKRAGRYSFDDTTCRVQMNFHRIRGFFKMQTMPVVGGEMSELMLGHTDPYGHAYNALPDDQLEKLFQKCESVLTITPSYVVSRDVENQSNEMQKMREELHKLHAVFDQIQKRGGAVYRSTEGQQSR